MCLVIMSGLCGEALAQTSLPFISAFRFRLMRSVFLDHAALAQHFHGLPDASLYPEDSVPEACNWAYLTERVLLLHLTQVEDGDTYTSHLYTLVLHGKDSVDLNAVKDGKRRLWDYHWVLADWVSFEETAPLGTNPYELRNYYTADNTTSCAFFTNFMQFPPIIGTLPWAPGNRTKYARLLALSDLLFTLDLRILAQPFNWDKYFYVQIRNCLKREQDKGNYLYRSYPLALEESPYLYPLLRNGYVHREAYTNGVEKYTQHLPVAATDFDAQTNSVLLWGIENQMQADYGIGLTRKQPWRNVHSWAYVTSRNCIVHVGTDAYANWETYAWTFVLVSLEMVDVDAIRNGSKKIMDFEWAISGGVLYTHIDYTVDAYLLPKYLGLEGNSLAYVVEHRKDIVLKSMADILITYARAPLDIIADPHVGLTEGFNWPTGKNISDVLMFESNEDPARQQYYGTEIVKTLGVIFTTYPPYENSEWNRVEHFSNSGDKNDFRAANVFWFTYHPLAFYSPYMNRLLYQSLTPQERELRFNLFEGDEK